jgi:protein-S-isoprenylcysteine O-methyltransferase Ste14
LREISFGRHDARKACGLCTLCTKRGDKRAEAQGKTRRSIVLGTILVVVLVLMLIGAVPTWSHSRSWGYMPSGVLGMLLVVVVVLLLLGGI